jgi:predicted nucleic acid-binding protein
LLSEDMQHGFVARGLTIVNPLDAAVHPKLRQLMDV